MRGSSGLAKTKANLEESKQKATKKKRRYKAKKLVLNVS